MRRSRKRLSPKPVSAAPKHGVADHLRFFHVPRWPWNERHIYCTWRDVQAEYFAGLRRNRWSARAWLVMWFLMAVAVGGWVNV